MTEEDFIKQGSQAITEAMTAINSMSGILKEQPPVETLGGLVTYDLLTLMLQTGNAVNDVLSLSKRTIAAKQDAAKILHELTAALKDGQARLRRIVEREV